MHTTQLSFSSVGPCWMRRSFPEIRRGHSVLQVKRELSRNLVPMWLGQQNQCDVVVHNLELSDGSKFARDRFLFGFVVETAVPLGTSVGHT